MKHFVLIFASILLFTIVSPQMTLAQNTKIHVPTVKPKPKPKPKPTPVMHHENKPIRHNRGYVKRLSDGNLQLTLNGVHYNLMKVDGGTFTMGATSEQGSDAESDEKPAHSVTLSSYYIGKTEVTQALWTAVMGSNPSYFKGENKPVEQVSWNDCQEFISRLNSQTGKHFSLPTEAQWEYAARGGRKSQGNKYSGSGDIGNVAWYEDNSSSETHNVRTKSSNELGIYDMTGNVWEWCSDMYGSYSSDSQTNPTGADSSSRRVIRGDGWGSGAWNCHVSDRNLYAPGGRNYDLGLRLALVAP